MVAWSLCLVDRMCVPPLINTRYCSFPMGLFADDVQWCRSSSLLPAVRLTFMLCLPCVIAAARVDATVDSCPVEKKH